VRAATKQKKKKQRFTRSTGFLVSTPVDRAVTDECEWMSVTAESTSPTEDLAEHYRLLWLSLDEQVRALATNAVFPLDASAVGHLRHTALQSYVSDTPNADASADAGGVLRDLAEHAARTDEHLRALHRRFAVAHQQQLPQDDHAEHSPLNLLRQQLTQTQSELERLRTAYDDVTATLQALHALGQGDRTHGTAQHLLLLGQYQRQQSALQTVGRLSEEHARAEQELEKWSARQRSLETSMHALRVHRSVNTAAAPEPAPDTRVFQTVATAAAEKRPPSPPPALPAATHRGVAVPPRQTPSLADSLLRRLATFQS
jgi:hypothetical protein